MFILPQFLVKRLIDFYDTALGVPLLGLLERFDAVHEFTGGSVLAQAKRAAGETAGTPFVRVGGNALLVGITNPRK